MTILEALNVAQEACHWEAENFGAEYTDDQIPPRYERLVEAAVVLARLEAEWPNDATETAALRRLRDVMALGLSIGYFGGSPPPAGDNERIGPQAQVRIEGWLAALDAILGKRDA